MGFSRNVAFLASNNCYWRVSYRPDSTASDPDSMFCDKIDGSGTEIGLWRRQAVASPHEASFIGAEYMGNVSPARDTGNFVVQPEHWLFRDTGLLEGNQFGTGYWSSTWSENFEPLAGGEADMLKLPPSGTDSISPANTELLARVWLRALTPGMQNDPRYGEEGITELYSHLTYYEDTVCNSRVFAAGGMGWSPSLYGKGSDSVAMSTMHQSLLDHFSGRKYIGPVYTDTLKPLAWSYPVELDGDVDVPAAKGLQLNDGVVVMVDSGVVFSDDGLIVAAAGSSTITGKNNRWGEFAVRSGGTLRVEAGATLTIEAPVYFVLQSGSNLVIEPGGTLNIKTNLTSAEGVNITVPAGATVNCIVPAEIYLSSDCAINVFGTFNVSGSDSRHVLFSRLGAGDPWMGLSYREGSSGKITHATIENAQKGVEGLGASPQIDSSRIQNNWTAIWLSAVPEAAAGEVRYDTLRNNSSSGIFLSNSYPRQIHHNYIVNNSYGIYAYAGSAPNLYSNLITGNTSYGILCSEQSPLMLGSASGDHGGHNVITQNPVGIACEASNALLGQDSGYAYNSIDTNTTFAVKASGSCHVWAQLDFWGHSVPPYYDTADYSIEAGSSVQLEPALPSDPNKGVSPLIQIANAGRSGTREASGSTLAYRHMIGPLSDSALVRGLQLLRQRNFEGATGVYRASFARERQAKMRYYILEQLGYSYRATGKAGFQTLLAQEVRPRLSKGSALYALSLELEALDLLACHEYRKALIPFTALSQNYPKSKRFAKHALFNLGYVNLVHLHNGKQASKYFKQLARAYPDDRLTALAKGLLNGSRARKVAVR